MKVILNSDILYSPQLLSVRLPGTIQTLFQTCAEEGFEIVIPTTALLELTRQQAEVATATIGQLTNAYKLLDDLSIAYTRSEPSQVVRTLDLPGLLARHGVRATIAEPTREDFAEAHRRACLHEPPHPLDSKSDEMRDLVIWMIALRLASHDGGALLISRDKVHVNPSGDAEAAQARLVRVRTIDEALEYFALETPGAALMKQVLEPIWSDLIKAQLPLPNDMSLIGVTRPRFVQGDLGLAMARSTIKLKTSDGKTLRAQTEVHIERSIIKRITLSDISIDDKAFKSELSIETSKPLAVHEDVYTERLAGLRVLIGESS